MKKFKQLSRFGFGASVAFFCAKASAATAVDYSALTSQADFSTTQAAVLAVMAVLATLYIAIRGGKEVLKALRSH